MLNNGSEHTAESESLYWHLSARPTDHPEAQARVPGPRGAQVTAGLHVWQCPSLGPGRGQEPGLRAGRAEHKAKSSGPTVGPTRPVCRVWAPQGQPGSL